MLKNRMDQNWLDSLHDILWKYWSRNGSQPLTEQKKTRPVYLRFFNTISFGLKTWEVTTFPDRRPCLSRRSDQWIGCVPTSFPCPLHFLDLLELHQRITRVANRVNWDRLQQTLELDYQWGDFGVSNGLHIEHLEINFKNFIVLYSSFLSF